MESFGVIGEAGIEEKGGGLKKKVFSMLIPIGILNISTARTAGWNYNKFGKKLAFVQKACYLVFGVKPFSSFRVIKRKPHLYK